MQPSGKSRRPGSLTAASATLSPQGVPDLSVDPLGDLTVARGPWGLWSRLVMPALPSGGRGDARLRERLRRARLLSVFLFFGFLVTLGLAPEIVVPSFDSTELLIVGGIFVLLALSAALNRSGYISSAAILFIASVVFAIAMNQLTYAGGLPLSGRTAFDFFVIPILLAGVVLPRRVAFLCWGVCSAFIVLDLQFGPKQADLVGFIAHQGIYTAAATPVVLLGAVTAVAWVAAGSVQWAIAQADRTRELERAYQFIAEHNRELEEAIGELQQVHAQAASGDLSVRASLSNQTLAPVAVSLNLMLGRLSEARGAEAAMGGLEQRLRRLEQAAGALASGHLRQSVPLHDLGRLTPLAQRLEHVRLGMLAALEHTVELADHAERAFQSYRRVVRDGTRDTLNSEALERTERETAQALDQCRQYARQVIQ